jgi:hypothetical protein
MNSRTVVFVCSTYRDLVDEREAVMDAILRLQLQHDSMEFFGARADRPIETSLEEVRNSDILLVIVGHKYGTLVPELEISYSEAEYNEGYSLDKPCLVYLRSENAPVLPKDIERDPEKVLLLEAWKNKLQERHTVAAFKASEDLAVQVAADLGRKIRQLGDPAEADNDNLQESTVIPLLETISNWLGGIDKFISVLGDTLTSVAIGSATPLIYDLEERGELAKFMSENSNAVLGIVDSDALMTKNDQESGLELAKVIKDIDDLVKYRLLPLDHEILDRASQGPLPESFAKEVGEFKLQLERKVRRAHSLLASIKSSI